MQTKSAPILALDPGLRDLGYAVIAGHRILASGVVPLRLLPRERRLGEARRAVHDLVTEYLPRELIVEGTHKHPTGSLNQVHRLGKSVARIAKRHGLPLARYAPQTVRKSVVGNGWATKRDVAIAVASRYPALRVHLTQDRRWKERYWQNMFDAVALALHHQTRPPSRSRNCG